MQLTNKIIKGFSSVSQVLAKTQAHKFKLGEYPKALEYSRPFRT